MKEKKELQQQRQQLQQLRQKQHRLPLVGTLFLGSIEIPRELTKFIGKSREEPMKAEKCRAKVLQNRHSYFSVYTFLRITRGEYNQVAHIILLHAHVYFTYISTPICS